MGIEIRVGPLTYIERDVEDLRGDEGQRLFGQVRHLPREIELNASLSGRERFLTRWHEVLHVFEDIYGVVLSESDVSLLSACIVQVLLDNPMMRGDGL